MRSSFARITLIAIVIFGVGAVPPGVAYAQKIQLIVRGDDFGMTQGSLAAVEKAMNEGVMTATSIIVPAPWFEGAAELARRNPGWCTGIHLCFVGEWRGYRWRPVLPWDKVRSLVDADGFFYATPKELYAHQPKLEEIDAELRAQMDLAKKQGVNIQYVDTHYFDTGDYPGLDALVTKLASDYHVPHSEQFGEKMMPNVYSAPIKEKLKSAVETLEGLTPGLWLWVCHVGIDSPEQRALIHTAPEDIFVDGVGPHRAEELRVVTSLEVKSEILRKRIELVDYRELGNHRHP